MFKMSLFLILMLPFTAAVTQQNHKVAARAGDDVTLPCENQKGFYDSCHSATWIFSCSGLNISVTLSEKGQIHTDSGSKSDRLSVTEDCSLVIKKVTAEDDGRYSCRQFRSGQQVTESYVTLSVNNREDATNATPSSTAGNSQSTGATATTNRGEEATKVTDTPSSTTVERPQSTGATSTMTTTTKRANRAVIRQSSYLTARVGDKVTLPCEEHRRNFYDGCVRKSCFWIFSFLGNREPKTVFECGQRNKDAGRKSLSVTEGCSLVLKKVTAEDDGCYTCTQFRPQHKFTDCHVHLVVVNTRRTPAPISISIRVGHDATLPCENGKGFHFDCYDTHWLFDSQSRVEVLLAEHREIYENAGASSDRLSVTEDCSLVLKKVTYEDGGQYICRQYNSGAQAIDSWVHLSVINKEHTTPSTTAGNRQSTSNMTATSKTISRVQTQTLIIIIIGGFSLFVITAAVIRWKMIKRNKTQMNDNTSLIARELSTNDYTEPETNRDRANSSDDVSYTTFSHIKNSSKEVKAHSKHHEGDAVTYSTVQISSNSAGPSTDDSGNYVNMKNI